MLPGPGEVLHFSHDPRIRVFEPHVARTAEQPQQAYVWAVDAAAAPGYWFPRECPRATAWTTPATTVADRDIVLGPGGGHRVHAIEYDWLEAMRTAEIYAYRLPDLKPVIKSTVETVCVVNGRLSDSALFNEIFAPYLNQ